MKQTKVLALRFSCANGKQYNVRVQNARADLAADTIKRAVQIMIQTKAFDFDGRGSAYQLASATYTTTNKTVLISAK